MLILLLLQHKCRSYNPLALVLSSIAQEPPNNMQHSIPLIVMLKVIHISTGYIEYKRMFVIDFNK